MAGAGCLRRARPALGPAPDGQRRPGDPAPLREFGAPLETRAPSRPLASEPHLLPPDYKPRSRVASGDKNSKYSCMSSHHTSCAPLQNYTYLNSPSHTHRRFIPPLKGSPVAAPQS